MSNGTNMEENVDILPPLTPLIISFEDPGWMVNMGLDVFGAAAKPFDQMQ